MRRFWILLAGALLTACQQMATAPHPLVTGAGVPISQLPAATTPLGTTEVGPLVQGGVTVKATAAAISAAGVIPDTVQTLPYTLQSSDVGGYVPFTGSGNLTVNAAVIPTGKIICYGNDNALGSGTNGTIAGNATLHGLPNTTVFPGGGGCFIARADGSYDWGPGLTGGDTALLSVAQQFTAAQSGKPFNVPISAATFTPNFNTAQNFEIDLTSACPCTLANPSTTLVAGQSGTIEIHQDATGNRLIGTYGSAYQVVGGTSGITLSTGANAVDYEPYYVNNAATAIVLGGIVKGPTH